MTTFTIYLLSMIGIAVIVFIALYFVEAGYGMLVSSRWGKLINNKVAWFFMEVPVFAAMIVVWALSPNRFAIVPLVFFLIFQIHYFQRVFIFPFLMKGKSKMPIGIMFMGVVFNLLNAIMQGYWIFFESFNVNYTAFGIHYTDTAAWLTSPWFIIGVVIFLFGFYTNLRSDYIIRHLRKDPTDTKHYLPKGGMFNFVTSANYFGELMEWLGFAVMTWSLAGLTFFIWTFANLVPRANTLYHKYENEFGDEMKGRRLKRVFPFIY